MVPAQFIAGVFSAIVGFIVGNLSQFLLIFISFNGWFYQIGSGFILITWIKHTFFGVLMLTEAVFGPLSGCL